MQVADRAIHVARNPSPDPVQRVDSTDDPGMVTTKYFFSLGAGFLHKYVESHERWQLFVYGTVCRSNFSGAATIAECLLVLSKSTQWKEAVTLSVISPLHTRAEVRGDTTTVHVCVTMFQSNVRRWIYPLYLA